MPSWCSPRRCGLISPGTTSNRPCASITAANAVTALPLAASSADNIKIRIVSALVLAPPALAAGWLGWPFLPIVVVAAAAGMGWEWTRLSGGAWRPPAALMMATPIAAAAASGIGHIRLAIAAALIGGLGG